MSKSPWSRGITKRACALSEWLYNLLLHTYPATFQHAYGQRMARVFRDSCRAVSQRDGLSGLSKLWLSTIFDLLINVSLERWQALKKGTHAMATSDHILSFPLRLWIALVATIIAFTVSLVASLNLYLLEDANHLTQAAYSVSPLLRFSYDGIYLSALAAGVAVCAIIGYTFIQRQLLVIIGLIFVALFVAVGGFGGLLVRHPETFLIFFGIFMALTLTSFLAARAMAVRLTRLLEPRPAAILGACVGAGSILLINVIALVLHTILLNPVSHELYMQGQIQGTHLNFTLIAMGLAILTMLVCMLSLGRALYTPLRQS